MNTLIAESIYKKYKNRWVVNDCSLRISSKEIVGLLGPNGAGKTTCFYIISGLISPHKGKVFLNNHNITHLSISNRSKLGIGYLPQDVSIFRKMSVEDNIMAVLQMNADLSDDEKKSELERLISEFNIEHIRKQMGVSLSGGESRRVEIARVLALRPKFIMLDEPFAGVDPISVLDIQKMIKKIKEQMGVGILITDHNIKETLSICDKATILSNGKILATGTPKEILEDKLVREQYLGREFELR